MMYGILWLQKLYITQVYPKFREIWGKYAYPLKVYRRWRREREKRIAERKALVRFWTDVLCQAGENAVHSGQFSREQINTWYSVFGKNADLIGLLPKHLTLTRKDMRDLKGAILKRIGPEARQAFKDKKSGKTKRWSAKIMRAQFKRAWRNAA